MGPPEHRCWVEQQQVIAPSQPNVPGAIIGGVLGGVLGHQIGGGRGNDVATAVGAVAGTAIGANANRGGPTTYTQDVQRCASVPGIRTGRVLGRDLRVPRRHASRAARVRAGRHDHRQRTRRTARLMLKLGPTQRRPDAGTRSGRVADRDALRAAGVHDECAGDPGHPLRYSVARARPGSAFNDASGAPDVDPFEPCADIGLLPCLSSPAARRRRRIRPRPGAIRSTRAPASRRSSSSD